MNVLAELQSLGAIDAESDFRPEFFVPSTAWENVRSQTNPIVVGRKGTGKTALRLALLNEAEGGPLVFATDLAFRDYPWNVHHSVFDQSVGGKSRYLETWLFLMLIELAKQVVGVDQGSGLDEQRAETHAAVKRFVEANWGSVAFDHKDIFRATSYSVTRSLKPSVAGFSAGQVEWTKVPRERLGDSLSAMNKWLKDALCLLLRAEASYFLIFDELDLDFDQADEQYLDSIIGLVLATQNFHRWAKGINARAMPVVLLRDDIYASLLFPDKNKITLGQVETITWDGGFQGPNSLKAVADARIRVLLGVESDDPWSLVFDDDVMRGTQHKYLHMVQRTYLRPRDLIQFANLCLQRARHRLGVPGEGDQVANEDVTAARTPYSNYLRAELRDEIFAHHPGWESWLEILRRMGGLTFRREQFERQCRKAGAALGSITPHEILEAFYRFGIIGFGRRGGAGRGGTEEYWHYRNPEVTFDPDAPYFKVHLGLKENLDLKEGQR